MLRPLVLFTLVIGALLIIPRGADAQDLPIRPRPRPHPIQPPRPPELVSIRLEDEMGNTLRTFQHQGTTYVLGSSGGRYNVRVSNLSGDRIETVVSVDGRDVLHGRASHSSQDRGYIVPAHGSVVIKGYRTSMAEVAAFRFSSPSDSYAGRNGQYNSMGIIRVSAYRERAEPLIIAPPEVWDDRPRPRPPRRPSAEDRAPAGGKSTRSEAGPAPRQDAAEQPWHQHEARRRPPSWDDSDWSNLGTEFGEQTRSQVMETTFERANRNRADQTLALRYDDASGLEARGIVVFQRPPPPLPLDPFPVMPAEPRFAQPPPPRLHWHYHQHNHWD